MARGGVELLPEDRLKEFSLVFSEAVTLGNEGRISRGYVLLPGHLVQARCCHGPCVPELIRLWESALASFEKKFPTEWYPERELTAGNLLRSLTTP